MALVYSIPKTARFRQVVNTFVATFNVPALGQYDFGVAGNTGQAVIDLEPNSIYFLDRVNVGGTIEEGEFLNAVATFPRLRFRYLIENPAVYPAPLPIVNYIDNQEVSAWVWSDKSNDSLVADLTGVLNQTPFLVGVGTVTLAVQLNLYQISESAFVSAFKNADTQTNVGLRTVPHAAPDSFFVGLPDRRV